MLFKITNTSYRNKLYVNKTKRYFKNKNRTYGSTHLPFNKTPTKAIHATTRINNLLVSTVLKYLSI